MPDMSDIYDLLLGGDPAAAQKRQAALLRNNQSFSDAIRQGTEQAHGLDLLNFVAQAGSNNPALARATAGLMANRQAQYSPQKLDKGVYVPATGQYAESPGVADEKEADREMRRQALISTLAARDQAATEAAAARRYAADQAYQGRVLMAALAGSRQDMQRERLDFQRERLANTVSQQNQQDVNRFGMNLNKAGIPQISQAVSDIQDLLAKPEGKIEGMGYGQETLSKIPVLSDMTVGPEGKANRAAVQRLINALTLSEAGKAVTKQEGVRQAITTMAGDNYSEKDFRNAMTKVILPALENVRANMVRSADPSIVDQYVKNDPLGFDPRKSFIPGKGTSPGGPVTPPSIPPLVPDQPRKLRLKFNEKGEQVGS